MPALVVANCYEVVIRWTNGLLNAANILHVFSDDGLDETQPIATQFDTWLTSTYPGVIPTNVTTLDVKVTDLRTAGGGTNTQAVNTAGTDPGQALPPQCSTVVSFHTALNSGRGRGRMYMPPPTQDIVDNSGVILAGRITDILGRFATLQTLLFTNAGGATLGVLSRADNVCRPVTAITMDGRVDTQRRRLNN